MLSGILCTLASLLWVVYAYYLPEEPICSASRHPKFLRKSLWL